MRLGIPIYGKMSASAFLPVGLENALAAENIEAHYYVSSTSGLPGNFHELPVKELQAHLRGRAHWLLRSLRRFSTPTSSTDLRLRETLYQQLFQFRSFSQTLALFLGVRALSRVPGIGAFCAFAEEKCFPSHALAPEFRKRGIDRVLIPAIGNFGFELECLIAREAQRLGIPAYAAITNYDNLINRGYRGFLPEKLGVWSNTMAADAIRYCGIPAKRIEVIGAPHYDSLLAPPVQDRDTFLRSLGLDPRKKTILYAGNFINHSAEIVDILLKARLHETHNLVYRPYPSMKVLASPLSVWLNERMRASGCYVSNSELLSHDTFDGTEKPKPLSDRNEDIEKILLLQHSDLLINHFSTISLEAAICDLPFIQVGFFDNQFAMNGSANPAVTMRQTHQQRPKRIAAGQTVHNREDLLRWVDKYLSRRAEQRDERRSYAEEEIQFMDGRSRARLVNMLKS